MPRINSAVCDLCGTCVGVCPTAALLLKIDALDVDVSRCTECNVCVSICPVAALTPSKQGE